MSIRSICYDLDKMAKLKVITYPNPILAKVAKPINKVTPEIVKLMDDMAETMYAESGVGLAAPQVGISKRVIVIDVGVELMEGVRKSYLIQLANPEIVSSEGVIEWEEGCLSVPEFRLKVKRKAKVVVRGIDKKNKEVEYIAECLLSVAFQHEIDHLDGKLLIDRVSKAEKDKYLELIQKMAIL